MRTLIIAATLLLTPALGFAMTGGPAVQKSGIDLTDQASLQRGAKYFVNYCMGCHSLKYMRYNRMAKDLGIGDKELRANLLFGNAEPGDLMTTNMRPADSEKWFGVAVPDLTLVTRWRTPDWVYTYLKTFYLDPTRPYGVNNLMFPVVGMPHALADLQGLQEPVLAAATDPHAAAGAIVGFKPVKPGKLSPAEYDTMVRDLTAFLTYAGEPFQLERQRLGVYVLLFLGLLFLLAYAMKKEFWKDVH